MVGRGGNMGHSDNKVVSQEAIEGLQVVHRHLAERGHSCVVVDSSGVIRKQKQFFIRFGREFH